MSQQYSSNFKICATCAYWLGPRSFTDIYHVRVEIPGKGAMERGECAKRNGPFYSAGKNFGLQANFTCRCYELWPAMEK